MHDTSETPTTTLGPPIISALTKKEEGTKHKAWIIGLPLGKKLLYTDGSRSEGGTVSSAWHCLQTTTLAPKVLFEGRCNIGNRADIEDGEINEIQEGLRNLRNNKTGLGMI